MRTASLAHGVSANVRGGETCTENPASCTISEVVRTLYPKKSWSFIAETFGLQERTAKYRMADLSITAANVVAANTAARQSGMAGETITAGQAVYLDPTVKKWLKADSNSATAAAKTAGGIALNAAALNQPLAVATSGDVTIGAALTAGSAYYLSETPGGLQPAADLASGENVCLIGLANSASVLNIAIQAPGVTL